MACSTDFFEDDLFAQNVLTDPLDEFLKAYLDRLKHAELVSPEDKDIKLITRAPDTHVSQIILLRANEIKELGVNVKVIFTQLAPSECVDRWVERMCDCDAVQVRNTIRWAKNPQILNAHEQLALGQSMCWSGDMMNRKRENRGVVDIYEHDAPGAARLVRQAFHALWDGAALVSKSQLKRLCVVYTGQQFEPHEQDHVLENWDSNFHHIISTRH